MNDQDTTDQYILMIKSFERARLETLLEEFDGGVTSSLTKRAIDVLQNTVGIDREKYITKIANIYGATQQLQAKPASGIPRTVTSKIAPPMIGVHIKFVDSPFYELIDNVLQTRLLVGHDIPQSRNRAQSISYGYKMTIHDINLIALNRDISREPEIYPYQIHMRLGISENSLLNNIKDYLPNGLNIGVNSVYIMLPPFITKGRTGKTSQRVSKPIDLTKYLKLNPNLTNVLSINWYPDDKPYYMAMSIVRHWTPQELLKQLFDRQPNSSEATKLEISSKFMGSDPELATTGFRISLLCPLSKVRMEKPVKSVNCLHFQCFDAKAFILMNEKKETWTCPVCIRPCLFKDLQVQTYFVDIIANSLPNDENEIELLANGNWLRLSEYKAATEGLMAQACVCLSDDDDEGAKAEKQKPPPEEPDTSTQTVRKDNPVMVYGRRNHQTTKNRNNSSRGGH